MPRPAPSPAAPAPTGFPLAAAGLVLLVVLLYARTLSSPFLFDDAEAIQRNPSIRQFSTALVPPAAGGTTTGRPVANLSFALSYRLSGDAPWGHRAVNIALHAAAALAVFGLARRLFAHAGAGRPLMPADAAGWLLAALWAAHPLQTESVICIAQRTEVLAGLFILLALHAFARSAEAATPGRKLVWQSLSVTTCLLGQGTKEITVVVPLLVLLWDRTLVAGSFAAAWRVRRGYYLALAGTWLPLAALLLANHGTRGGSAGLGLGVSSWSYLLTQADALALYLRLAVWPHPLVVDYGTALVGSLAAVWWQGLLVLAGLALTVWALVRRPLLGLAGAWFFLLLAPSSSVIPLISQTVAEHRMYLPLAAVLGLFLAGLHRLAGARLWLAGSAWLVVCSGLTLARNLDYRSALNLWSRTAADCPANPRAHLNLGVELQHTGRLDEAVASFSRAVALEPAYVSAHYQLGATLLQLGRLPAAQAALETAVRLGPRHADAWLALGNARLQTGDAAGAIAAFTASLDLQPAADVHYNLALALLAARRDAEAETHLRAALALAPELAAARQRLAELHGAPSAADHRQRGLAAARAGRFDEAATHFQALLAIDARDADALANLGNVRLLQGRAREAIALYETVLRIRPDDARTQENLRLARESRP